MLLTLTEVETECGFDFLFVFDGPASRGRLLAALSGNAPPPPLLEAASGQVGGATGKGAGLMKEGQWEGSGLGRGGANGSRGGANGNGGGAIGNGGGATGTGGGAMSLRGQSSEHWGRGSKP